MIEITAREARDMVKNSNTTKDDIEYLQEEIRRKASTGYSYASMYINPATNYKELKTHFVIRGFSVKKSFFS